MRDKEISPAHIALLASIGITEVIVYAKPAVTVITTGSELVPYNSDVSGASIRNSNSIMLEKAVLESGARVFRVVHVEDSLQKTIDALEKAAADSNIILISGGVSVGPHDHVKPASEHAGFKELFWRVNQRPGKPFYFARNNNCLLFGLPGNPVSALMTYINFVHSAIGRIEHRNNGLRKVISRLGKPITNRSSRDTFFRIKFVKEDRTLCESVGLQGSHMIMSLVESDGFIEVKGNEHLPAESEVKILLFPWSK
jgi:molybdopterin molybdotransferase